MKTQRTALFFALLLLGLVALGTSAATAQTELFFATGVDSTGWAQAQSNADGHVLIESPQYPRGLWLHCIEPVEDRLIGWEGLAAFLREREQGQAGRVVVQIESSTTLITSAVEVENPKAIETLVAHLQQMYRPAGTSLGERPALYIQVFRGGLASLQEGVILYLPLFMDANLEGMIRKELGQSHGHLAPEDVASLIALPAAQKYIHSLAGIEHLIALKWLNLYDNQITDLTPLAFLTNLNTLYLHYNQIVDITPLNQLNNLETLDLYGNQIVDIAPLQQLINLNRLTLHDNQIVDLSPLVANTGLGEGDWLNLENNPLSDQARNEQIPALQARGVNVHY